MSEPMGCLGCNREAIVEFLQVHGVDPERFTEVPEPRHKWKDVIRCEACGRCWLRGPESHGERREHTT